MLDYKCDENEDDGAGLIEKWTIESFKRLEWIEIENKNWSDIVDFFYITYNVLI